LSVQPSSGAVGSVVTVRDSADCLQMLFGPAGAIQNANALGYSQVVRYVIPAFVGDPAVPVTKGHFEIRGDVQHGRDIGRHESRRSIRRHGWPEPRSVRGDGVDTRRGWLLARAT
jgi:hypothetical protein